MRHRVTRLLWITAATAVSAFVAAGVLDGRRADALAAQAAQAPAKQQTGPSNDTPFAKLRKKSKFAKTGLTPGEARDFGYELARQSFALGVMHTVGIDDAVVRQFGDALADRQLAWENSGRKKGVHEDKLLKALNRHLELEGAPEYLQMRRRDLGRVRLEVWIQLPELSSGIDRRQAHAGQRVLDPWMSPFEAYLASDLLLYQKRLNDDYLRTDAEDFQRGHRPSLPRKPGLYGTPSNPRALEFDRHMTTLALKKWQSVEAVKGTIEDILNESEGER